MRNFSYLLLVLVLLMSCGKKEGDQIADVGVKLNLSLSPDTITDFLYVTMDYEYEILDDFNKIDKDYLIFVLFWRLQSKEMLIQDDHLPVKQTTEWKAGDKVSYSRMFFIPKFLDELDIDFEGFEEIKLQSGLYDPQNPTEKIVLFNQVLNVQPASINAPDIIYSEGWNEEEMNLALSNPFYRVWRWTTKKAECIIENPKKKSVLIIKGGLHKSLFQDQTVILKINDTLLEAFISDSVTFEKKYMLTPEQLGDEPEFKLTIETNKTFIPSSLNPENKDSRELGVQLYLLYFREVQVD